MALTPTTEKETGFNAPEFTLKDTISGNIVHSKDLFQAKATLIMFICNHCPFVIHVREQLVQLANDYSLEDVSFVAISSNDANTYPQDGPSKMKELGDELHFPFPYLFDETQNVAKAYDAACTPDFTMVDQHGKCVYRGQLDDSRPGNGVPVTGKSIREVLDRLLKNETIEDIIQKPSIGCSIKWK